MGRRRFNWLPTLGTNAASNGSELAGRQVIQTVPATGEATVVLTPLLPDIPVETDANPGDSLSSFIANEYIIERIVGNCFCNLATSVVLSANVGVAALITTGLFIARTQDETVDAPIGADSLVDNLRNYSPQYVDNIREPWIWRRTWILGIGPVAHAAGVGPSVSTAAGNPGSNTVSAWPASNAYYGSSSSGPFIDSPSKRRVGQDERLFWALHAQNWPVNATTAGEVRTLVSYLDYRVLGMLVKGHNKSAF